MNDGSGAFSSQVSGISMRLLITGTKCYTSSPSSALSPFVLELHFAFLYNLNLGRGEKGRKHGEKETEGEKRNK
jgi:hypothetical protein